MLKKILCLVLSVCMVLTMFTCITATADTTPDIVATVTTSEEGDGSFKITFASTSSSVEAFQVVVPYDKSKYTLLVGANPIATNKLIFNQNIEGSIIFDDNAEGAGVSWYTTNGMMLDKNTGETLSANSEGLYEIAYLTFNLNKANLTDDDYLNKLKLEFNAYSFAAPTDKVPTKTFVEFNIPDTRTEIEGLTATPVEGLKYTGTAFEAKALIAVNALETDTVEYTTVPAEVKNAGDYKVTATVKRAGYKPTAVSTDVTIGKADTTITLASDEITYGEKKYAKDFTVTDGVDKAEITVTDYTVADLNAGEKEITATATSANYNVTVNPGTLTVAKKAIKATVKNVTKVYGEADPAFEATTEGLEEGDELTYTFDRVEGDDAGEYAISATAENDNYIVEVKPGTLTINPLAVKMIVKDVKQPKLVNKMTEPEISWEPALIVGDEIEVSTAVKDAEGNKVEDFSVVGAYKVVATVEGEYKNYAIEAKEVEADYEIIETIPVYIKLTGNAKEYDGAAITDADVKFEIVEADKYSKENVKISVVEPGKNAGKYEIKYELVEGGDVTNLTHSVMIADDSDAAEYVITPKKATITVANAEKKVGAEDPAFTATVEGLVGEDTLSYTLTRAEGTAAGEYAITATLGENPNYDITVNDGTLTISKYAVTVTAPTVTVYFGNDIPELKATVTIKDAIEGLINEINVDVEVWDGETKVVDIAGIDNNTEKTFTTKAVVTCDEGKFSVETPVEGKLIITEASGRPSGGGTVIKPATKPEDDKKDEENKDDETGKPAASANIALKEDAKEVKFIEGFEDKTFRPDVNATRNEVVSALTALFDISDVKNAPAFTDTDDKAIKELAAAGVINGYEDGSFKGHNDVTRAEFVKLVAAALKLEAAEGATANFSDIDGHWAAEFIKTFVGKGYLVGYPDGTFRPESKITRAEMVVVMTRVVGTVDAEDAINFADLDDAHWAYEYIKKAAK